jgi:hypothetical protein
MLLMGKSTISMVIFNSYVKLPEGKNRIPVGHFWMIPTERFVRPQARRGALELHHLGRCWMWKFGKNLVASLASYEKRFQSITLW